MTRVVIMAGGQGLRLHPLTETTPKPLCKVGGKPILQQVIEQFAAQGFVDIWLAVRYRAHLIKSYFGAGAGHGVKISYLEEDAPLGTAGALSLLPPGGDVIVMNADVLARVDFSDLLRRHRDEKADATVALGLYQYQVPYGVAQFDAMGSSLSSIAEKPIENFYVAAGIYVLTAGLHAGIVGPCDMPDVLNRADRKSYYQIEGAWFDVGNFIDLARANNSW